MDDMIYEYTNQWGTTYRLRFGKGEYSNNGSLAVVAECFDEDMGYWAPYATVTVNLDDPEPMLRGENFAFVDENNLAGMTDWLEEQGIAYRTEDGYEGQSGFCSYPLVEFEADFLESCGEC